jgi:broad specificity phosphatase PhoE
MPILRKYVVFIILLIFLNWGVGFVLIKTYLEFQNRQISSTSSSEQKSDDFFWANEIIKGGYILYFRHAEREKWNTVTVFDWEEVNGNLDGRRESWKNAVCLTEKGIEEAKLINRVFMHLEMPVSKVVSSPSCRARETAFYALGGSGEVWISTLHATAVTDLQRSIFKAGLKELLILNSPPIDENLVVFGHGNTLNYYENDIFLDVYFNVEDWEIDELGFYVLQVREEGIIAHHAFKNFSDFASSILEYDIN